jgi:hypothetical protein
VYFNSLAEAKAQIDKYIEARVRAAKVKKEKVALAVIQIDRNNTVSQHTVHGIHSTTGKLLGIDTDDSRIGYHAEVYVDAPWIKVALMKRADMERQIQRIR